MARACPAQTVSNNEGLRGWGPTAPHAGPILPVLADQRSLPPGVATAAALPSALPSSSLDPLSPQTALPGGCCHGARFTDAEAEAQATRLREAPCSPLPVAHLCSREAEPGSPEPPSQAHPVPAPATPADTHRASHSLGGCSLQRCSQPMAACITFMTLIRVIINFSNAHRTQGTDWMIFADCGSHAGFRQMRSEYYLLF